MSESLDQYAKHLAYKLEKAEAKLSQPHKMMVVDGEIQVCDTCINSEGNPIAWDQTWHSVPEHLMVDGKVNYLVLGHGAYEGKWWVATTELNGEPHSGMPLDYFLNYRNPNAK